MLVLARKEDESIIIDGRIEVKIVEIDGNIVRVGIDAPENVSVWRKEIAVEKGIFSENGIKE